MTIRQEIDSDQTTPEAAGPSHKGMLAWFDALKWKGMRERDRQNERRVNVYAFAWVAVLISANVIRTTTQIAEPFIWLVVLLSTVPGFLFVKSYLKMFREGDEMLRLIQLEAMACGFGTAFLVGLTVIFLVPASPVWGIAILMPMVLAYCIRVILAGREVARDAAANVDADEEVK